MYYELYVDSLFMVNFVMNLYLLLLVNQSSYRSATRLRLILGAAVGAVFYLIPFLWSGSVWFKLLLGLGVGISCMILIAFRIESISSFLKVVEGLVLWSFLLGGVVLFLVKRLPVLGRWMAGMTGVLLMGAMVCLAFSYMMERRRRLKDVCRVTLVCEEGSVKLTALVDSGNGLVEPISGKPVSIIEQHIFAGLWSKTPPYYRAIPFHSIGRNRGILKGYLLPEIRMYMNRARM